MSDQLRYYEDVAPGETARCGPVVVTREAILAFAQVYDPQPFHLDEDAGARSILGGLAASGWHTTALGMRLFYDGWVCRVASMGAPGIDELRWLRPVRPGDRISACITVEETRPSGSRPDRGFARMLLDLRNAADESVMTQRFSIILQRRDAVQAPRVERADRTEVPDPVRSRSAGMAPSDPMLGGFYEDLLPGHRISLGTQLFAPETITTFARAFDPQYFHLDPAAAKDSHFGGLVASGWQTAAFWMKHFVAARARAGEARQAAGHVASVTGPSPGFDDLKWIEPVRAGDILSYEVTILDKRQTKRTGWGLVRTQASGHTAEGTLAFSFVGRILWPMQS